jgi:hypothetical protein
MEDRTDGADETVAALLAEAEAVYEEYDQGYMDADAALSRLRPKLDALRDASEE